MNIEQLCTEHEETLAGMYDMGCLHWGCLFLPAGLRWP
jgi:hypothetical protein